MVSVAGAPLRHRELAGQMAESLAHRGPDGCGTLARPHVLLGTRRLRIVDLDPRADQPFADPGQCVWLVCNGEIYNAPELRRRFSDYPFRSRADVEVILPLYLELGACGIRELSGMFALALWDERSRTLVLARDRAGEKPLFYSERDGELWFASELQALLAHPAVSRRLDPTALEEFVTRGHVSEPRTMFAMLRGVEAGTVLSVGPRGLQTSSLWQPPATPAPNGDLRQIEAELGTRMVTAIRRQAAADVPVGVFTSGGVDSSLIAALAAEVVGSSRLRTFTAGFTAPSYDESAFAARLAKRLGTTHETVRIDEAGLAEAFETVTARVAEPIADPAVLPTFLLARAARKHVKVVLSGEGADELFGGYPTYLGHALAPRFQQLPTRVQELLRRALLAAPASTAKVPVTWLLQRFVAEAGRPWLDRHLAWTSTGLNPSVLLRKAGERPSHSPPPLPALPALSQLNQAMLLDFQTSLRHQLLVKLDRATMLVGLEARAPYLDREVTDFAMGLDPRLKVRGLETKWLLKRLAGRWVPRRNVHRRKRGLSVPIASLLNGALRGEADRLLAPDRLRQQGLISHVYVGRLLADHRGGRANTARGLWTLFVLQRWLERWVPEVAG